MREPRRVLVALAADRMRWYANPPMALRPTPALAGWTLEEWVERCAIGRGKPLPTGERIEEVFARRFQAALDTDPYDPLDIAREAAQLLIKAAELDTAGGTRWRAVPKNQHSA